MKENKCSKEKANRSSQAKTVVSEEVKNITQEHNAFAL